MKLRIIGPNFQMRQSEAEVPEPAQAQLDGVSARVAILTGIFETPEFTFEITRPCAGWTDVVT
jgi:hypothetical protein